MIKPDINKDTIKISKTKRFFATLISPIFVYIIFFMMAKVLIGEEFGIKYVWAYFLLIPALFFFVFGIKGMMTKEHFISHTYYFIIGIIGLIPIISLTTGLA